MVQAQERNVAETTCLGRIHFRALLLPFAANGLQAGVYMVLVADLAASLQLSPRELSIALASLAAAAIPGTIAGGWLADRLGRRPVLVAGSAGVGLFFLLLAVIDGYAALVVAYAFGGLAFGFFDMVPNALGGDYEGRYGRTVMTRLHAGHNGAALLGSLACGILLVAGTDHRRILAAVGGLLVLLALVAVRLPLPERARPPKPDDDGRTEGAAAPRWLVGGVVVAALIVGFESLTAAALEGYASIYLREVLASGALVGGLGIAAFQGARLLGQLGSVAAIDRAGERGVLVAAGGGLAVGLGVLTATDSAAVGAVGLLLIGLCAAPIAPIAFSLAARAAPGRVGRAVAVVWGAFYVAFLVGPLLVGALAAAASLRAALAVFVLASLGIAVLAHRAVPAPARARAEPATR